MAPSREVSLERAFARYLCLDSAGDAVATIKYRRARLYYMANQWETAAALFRDIVDHHAMDQLAAYAANMYLDCLNILSRLFPERRTSTSSRPRWSGSSPAPLFL